MILTWNDYAIASVEIDGVAYSSETGTVTVDFRPGHTAQMFIFHI